MRRAPFLVGMLAVAALASGCDVDPFCLDCEEVVDGGYDGGYDAGRRDAGGARDAGPPGTDGGDACRPEICNEVDDDCDGNVDEGFDTNTDTEHCGGCGELCAPLGAFAVCTDGVCGFESCDVGRLDIDMNPDNGCEYRCLVETDDDAICDLRDNDCDGEVDEDIDLDVDPANCGACGRSCVFAHAAGLCVGGDCQRGDCETDYYDLDGDPLNGCEVACTPLGPDEVCNGRDDDCDGMVDEGDPGGGAACGDTDGLCEAGVEQCVGGTIECVGGVRPTTEICDGEDNDCDGERDEGNPDAGRVCGMSEGTCSLGREVCMGGGLVCQGDVGPAVEICDGLDNDCDGLVDNGNPGGGVPCGSDVGECVRGTFNCRGGALQCDGATGATDEICDGLDNDCDGVDDEGDPGGGGSCGTDVGICQTGTLHCEMGTLNCVGEVTALPAELCNGLNDDCDMFVDEGNPGGGVLCGGGLGECGQGLTQCSGGVVQCIGEGIPALETCDGLDNDCDGPADEDFNLNTDPNNCGMCGRSCSMPHATAGCSAGACVVLACDAGWVNADLSPTDPDGCEYNCSFAGAEACNNVDDDCDLAVDEDVVTPLNFCNPNGVCMGTMPSCEGAAGWQCNYPSTYEPVETLCDGLDNDCDGPVDEPFPGVGTACFNGTGACQTSGTIQCLGDFSGTYCTAPMALPPAAFETCNNRDDDCDTMIDEEIEDHIDAVDIGGGTLVMRFEASRPDATSGVQGGVLSHACSNPNVLPWTNVTWAEAQAACCAINDSGTCSGAANEWQLCAQSDWQLACEGPGATACDWSYDSACTTSAPLECNGEEFDSDMSMPGDQDLLYPTGSTAFGMCDTSWGLSGVIYDLSGNVKEWTATSPSAGLHVIRGGSYNNIEAGRTCQFDFTVGDGSFSFPHTGFRCCRY